MNIYSIYRYCIYTFTAISIFFVMNLDIVQASPEIVGDVSGNTINIDLDPAGISINAIEGSISIPEGVKVYSINDRPEIKDGKVVFSGITPGGFGGMLTAYSSDLLPGRLFSITFDSISTPSSVDIDVIIDSMYQKDGQIVNGVISKPISLKINDLDNLDLYSIDTDPPESFTVDVVSDRDIFSGRSFIVFNTQDKGSGIDFYSVQEGNMSPVTANSPYELKDQSLTSNIVVRAYDHAGNVREIYIEAEKYTMINPILWGIIGVFILLSFIWLYSRKSH
jgi:hypothetical protein